MTAWETAEIVQTIRPHVGGVVQIAYDYEFWMTADAATRERMARAFTYPDIVVATSHAVTTMLRDAGREPGATITCGLNPDVFHRRARSLLQGGGRRVRPRPGPVKRGEDAVAALERLRATRDIHAIAVSSGRINLPPWMETVDEPTDEAMSPSTTVWRSTSCHPPMRAGV